MMKNHTGIMMRLFDTPTPTGLNIKAQGLSATPTSTGLPSQAQGCVYSRYSGKASPIITINPNGVAL